MSADIQPLKERITRLETKGELSSLSRSERLQMIHRELGFYPQSNDEASDAEALMGQADQAFPTLQYLNIISAHQHKYEADASKSVRAIVHTFGDYAGNAMNEAFYMEQFIERLSDMKPNNFTSFANLYPTSEWRYDNNQIAAFTAMTRYLEIDHFVNDGVNDTLGKQHLLDLTQGEERFERIIESLGVLRASSLENTAKAVQKNQNARFDYWYGHLEASTRHLFARDVAMTALNELNDVR